VDPSVELGHRDLHGTSEPAAKLVERPDVVTVAVRERDAPDRGARLVRGREQRVAAALDGRVHEREAVVLTHEICVHEAQPRELDEVRVDLTHARDRRTLPASPAKRRFEQMTLAFAASSVLLT
jgi:hypothetical protein